MESAQGLWGRFRHYSRLSSKGLSISREGERRQSRGVSMAPCFEFAGFELFWSSFHFGAAARLCFPVTQVNLTVRTALCFISCVIYNLGGYLALIANVMMHESSLMCLEPTVAANSDEFGLLNAVRQTQFDATPSTVASERR